MFCQKCGTQNPDDAIFCSKCGTNQGIEPKKANLKYVTPEFILGLLGGIFGFVASLLILGIGSLGTAFGAEGASTAVWMGIVALILSILGIIGAAKINQNPRGAGQIMILDGVIGLLFLSFLFWLPALLILLGGIVAYRKE